MSAPEHAVSLATWDIAPAPAIAGGRLSFTVGAICACGCALEGAAIVVHDHRGREVGSAALGPAPLPGTRGLLWARLHLPVGVAERGARAWSIICRPRDGTHREAGTTLRFTVTAAPAHPLDILVRDRASDRPLAGVELRVGAFRGMTDAAGAARLLLPGGRLTVRCWKPGYRAEPTGVTLPGDRLAVIAADAVRDDDPFEDWC